jgi:hypothetical protein
MLRRYSSPRPAAAVHLGRTRSNNVATTTPIAATTADPRRRRALTYRAHGRGKDLVVAKPADFRHADHGADGCVSDRQAAGRRVRGQDASAMVG